MIRRQGVKFNYTKEEKYQFAKKLRDNPTIAEKFLWEEIRCKKLGVKFRRQSLVWGWIADFYCPIARLVIELDGQGHNENKDSFRDEFLRSKGIRTLRFPNLQVQDYRKSVMKKIKQVLCSQLSRFPPRGRLL